MRLEPFKLERIMSQWQNEVEFDLSSSGVDAAYLRDFISAFRTGDVVGYKTAIHTDQWAAKTPRRHSPKVPRCFA